MDDQKPFTLNLSPFTSISIEQIRPEHTWKLRRDILYPAKMKHEMEMEEDADGIHFGAFLDDKLVGVVSLFQIGNEFQFRKLAVDTLVQKQGIGKSLLVQITKHVEDNGGGLLWCNARVDAIGFYQKLGFSQTGKLFTKNDIDYEIMEKQVTPLSDQPA